MQKTNEDSTCVSPKQASWYLLSGTHKKSHLRHGMSYNAFFRGPHTPTVLGNTHFLLLVVKEKISRFWKMHAHKQGSHRLRETSRESPQSEHVSSSLLRHLVPHRLLLTYLSETALALSKAAV